MIAFNDKFNFVNYLITFTHISNINYNIQNDYLNVIFYNIFEKTQLILQTKKRILRFK